MLSKESAKKLKDAGFPQNSFSRKEIGGPEFLLSSEERIIIPTLLELIEACGEKFSGLMKVNGAFEARSTHFVIDGIAQGERCFGGSLEEAVAHLWLRLNKK